MTPLNEDARGTGTGTGTGTVGTVVDADTVLNFTRKVVEATFDESGVVHALAVRLCAPDNLMPFFTEFVHDVIDAGVGTSDEDELEELVLFCAEALGKSVDAISAYDPADEDGDGDDFSNTGPVDTFHHRIAFELSTISARVRTSKTFRRRSASQLAVPRHFQTPTTPMDPLFRRAKLDSVKHARPPETTTGTRGWSRSADRPVLEDLRGKSVAGGVDERNTSMVDLPTWDRERWSARREASNREKVQALTDFATRKFSIR
jgi:hypothetical protein